jgi:hypothetical protein
LCISSYHKISCYFTSGLTDGQSCQAIDSFLRGVYINVEEILNSDWLKSYIYFPYTPTQPISKNAGNFVIRTDTQLHSLSSQNITNSTSESDSEDENRIRDDEKCCVCKLFTPKEIRESPCLIFTKWLQCDQYKHWVHYSFLRGVYINVEEILNSDWLKSYIYFPYTPT